MAYKFNFVSEKVIHGKAYPAGATWQAQPYTTEWRQFIQHWPYTLPADLHEHCVAHQYPFELHGLDTFAPGSFYTIHIGWFDFGIDYFALLPNIIQHLRERTMRVLFYYDEGDNPFRIKSRLDQLCATHGLDTDCYVFVSANTAADQIENFFYFPCDELLYWLRNKNVPAVKIHDGPRQFEFTALSRAHKWWRATVMTDLRRQGILDKSIWSYNSDYPCQDVPQDNPLCVSTLDIQQELETFLSGAPYRSDDLTTDQHNDHAIVVSQHFDNSYCNLILETHFDADQSGGAFLTEKTFKCLKHGQPFVIIGAPGSLQALRNLGYRTFDHAIDNSYDLEPDNMRRWQMILKTIKQLQSQDMHRWFLTCWDDLVHNQNLFADSKYNRLNILHDKLLHQLATT